MCFAELVDELRRLGVSVTEPQIRWAIKTGKVSKPTLDGSHRFKFTNKIVAELAAQFGQTAETVAP